MITSLFLEDWRSHGKTAISFRKGTNLIVGIMGSGKSSILDAISFAFFSQFPALERRRLSLVDMIRHGKDSARVRLEFEWKGEKYEIAREIKKEKKSVSSSAEIRKAGALLAKGQAAVTDYLERLIQIDYQLFSRAIYSPQNGIDYFLSIEPGRRREEMDGLLGLDRFESARENAVTVINRTRQARKALEEKFSKPRLEEMRSKEKEALAEAESARVGLAAVQGKMEGAKAAYSKSSEKLAALTAKKKESDALTQEISRASGAVGQLREQLAGKELDETKVSDVRRRKTEGEKALAECRAVYLAVQGSQNSLSKEIGTAEARAEEAKKSFTELEKAASEMEKALAGEKEEEILIRKAAAEKAALEAGAEIKSLSLAVEKAEDGMKRLSPELSKCPVCRQPLDKDGITHVVKEYKQEIAKNREKQAVLAALKSEKSGLSLKLDTRLRQISSISQKMSLLRKPASLAGELETKLVPLRKTAAELAAQATEKRQAAEGASAALQDISIECSKLEELLAKKARLAQLESARLSLEGKRTALAFVEQDYEGARLECEGHRLTLERISSEHASFTQKLKSAAEIAALASSERKTLEENEKRIAHFSKLEEELSLYKNALLETQSGLRKEVIEAINAAMNDIWGMVYPYADYKGLRVTADERGYSFELYDGQWRAAEVASGGERASMALAFRVALAAVLTPNASMLILDEPTHNLDKEAVSVLAHALQYNLPELVEQSFVITHDEGLMGSEFASAYRLSREKGEGAPSQAEEI